MNRLVPLLLLLSFLTSCVSSPTDDDANAYPGDNGIILNGSGYEDLDVPFNGDGDALYTSLAGYSATLVTCYGTANGESATFYIAFPSNSTGTYAWKRQSASTGEQDSYMQIGIGAAGETVFYAQSGTTVVTEFGGIGSKVAGRFSGSLRTLDGAKSLSVRGKFRAIRTQ